MGKSKNTKGNGYYPYMRPNAHYSPAEVRAFIDSAAHKVVEETTYRVLAVMVGIVHNKYGALNKKATRLKVLSDMVREGLETIDQEPTPEQLEAEAEFLRQTGFEIHR